MIGKNFEKKMRAKTNPAESPAIIDHSTHEGIRVWGLALKKEIILLFLSQSELSQ